jgi:hypothetical protein
MDRVAKTLKIVPFIALFSPIVVFAQTSFRTLVHGTLVPLLDAVIPVIFGVALIAILWAGSQLVLHADNEQKRTDSKRSMFWGIIILFIMLSMWGLVNLIKNSVL